MYYLLRWLKQVRTFFINQLLTPILPDEVDIRFIKGCFQGYTPALNI